MSVYRWAECTRTVLGQVLPEAVVVLTIGATEQHGPHLPTGTDTVSVEAVVAQAVEHAAASAARDVVLAPVIPFGASDHHFLFGATLSLESTTTIQVLVDLMRSVEKAGGLRVFLVNGHGGNRGPCHAAIHIASTRYGMHLGYVDYWSLLPRAGETVKIPGHAGAFETAMVSHLRPGLLGPVPPGDAPRPHPDIDGVALHSEAVWRAVDGYTDQPARGTAADGARWLNSSARALADRIVAFSQEF